MVNKLDFSPPSVGLRIFHTSHQYTQHPQKQQQLNIPIPYCDS